jgi:hypothetical protein
MAILRHGSVAVLATLLAFAAAEVCLRALAPQFRVTRDGMHEHDPQRGYRLRPDHEGDYLWGHGLRYHVAVNGFGHRDGAPDRRADCRLLALGDSHTFGPGVDQAETYPARLEALLRERTGRAFEVVNAGVQAYGWLEEKEAARESLESGVRYDFVLLQTSWNDVNDNAMGVPKFLIDRSGNLITYANRHRPGGYGAWGMKTSAIGPIETAALRHSHVATLLIGGWRSAWHRWRRADVERDIERYKWQASRRVLGELLALLRDRRVGLLAIVHPGAEVRQFDMRRAETERLVSLLREHDVPISNLREALAALDDASEMFVPGDEHFNARGYEWMSRELVEPVLARLEADAPRCLRERSTASVPHLVDESHDAEGHDRAEHREVLRSHPPGRHIRHEHAGHTDR